MIAQSDGAEVRRTFRPGASKMASENFNEHTPKAKLAMLVYRLTVLYRYEHKLQLVAECSNPSICE